MSFYPDMIRPAANGQTRAFTVVVNSHGEVVVCSLDKDGKPTGFATSKTGAELLSDLARTLLNGNGCFRINIVEDDKNACYRMLGVTRWAEAAEIINGKPSVKRKRILDKREEWLDWSFTKENRRIERYLVRDIENGGVIVTDLGKKLDAMHESDKAVV